MVVTVLLYVSAIVVLSAIVDQILFCTIGRGPWTRRKGNAETWHAGTHQISSYRWMAFAATTTLWTLLGLSTEKINIPLLTINGAYTMACLVMVVVLLLYPPRRSRLEKIAMLMLLLTIPAVFVVAGLNRQILVQHPEITRLFPFIASFGFSLFGRVAQISTLVRSKTTGKLTWSDPVICITDCTLWILFGMQLNRYDIWVPCMPLLMLDVLRLVLMLRYRSPK